MSDQDEKNNEPPVKKMQAGESALDGSGGKPPVTSRDRKSKAASGKASSGIAWLALLLVIALAGGVAWVIRESQGHEAALLDRVGHLETIAQQKETRLEASSERQEQALRSGLSDLEATLTDQTSKLSLDLESVDARLAAQHAELERFSASDRDSWLLAEVEYLLRLANQRLIMAGDSVAAQALLTSADNVLRGLEDVNLHAVRAAVAADLAAVRAVPKVDVEGIYLRLSALIEQAGKLVIFQMPQQPARPSVDAAPGWQGRLRQGYEAALAKLSDYIIIRRRDVPMQALMDPQWEGLVRQNLRMLLEQAQVALLSGNQSLYRESLGRAGHWVAQFLESDEASARAIGKEITQLTKLTIAVPLPDISRSLQALDEAVEQRGGSE